MNQSLTCLVVDDEPFAQQVLEQYIDDAPGLKHARSCKNALEAMEYLEENSADLLFLDINMPRLSGIDLLETLPNPPAVIISTAYDDFALKGYELDVIDYLLKPFSFERFLKGVQKARDRLQASAEPRNLNIKSDGKVYRIRLNEILFIKSMGDYVSFHLNEQRLISYRTLSELEQTLPRREFLRVHRSYIVRVSAVEFLEGTRLKLGKRDRSIPVGPTYRESVLKLFS